MSNVIQQLRHDLTQPGQLETFLRDNTFPIVEGTTLTFAYHGPADAVILRHWIYGLPSAQEFQRLGHTGLWVLTMELPEESRMEYKLEIVRGGRRQLIADPLNERHALDPFGANSVACSAGYIVPDWAEEHEGVRQGTLEEHQVPTERYGGTRDVSVYVPARYRKTRRYPLLVAHDGLDYVQFSSLKQVLDNLIERLEIPPMIVALTQSPNRLEEYAASELHGDFVATELLPYIEDHYSVVQEPGARGLMGASFGAVASLATAWRHPGVFGNLLLQSGSFAFTDIGEHDYGDVFNPVVDFTNAFRAKPGRPADRVYLTCGTYERGIYFSRSLLPVLQDTGMETQYTEARDGHNWENWRDRLREGLTWLYPGPLWVVYE